MLTSKQRAALRREANGLDPVFQLGKGEIDADIIKAVADCLAARELIKLKVLDTSPYTPKEAAAILAEETGADTVQVIGSRLVLFLAKPGRTTREAGGGPLVKPEESRFAGVLAGK